MTQKQLVLVKKEIFRKSIHLSFCIFAILAIKLKLPALTLLLIPAALIGIHLETSSQLKSKLYLGPKRKFGAIILAISLSAVALIQTETSHKIFAILILAIADLGASIVGKVRPIKSIQILQATKSVGGSAAFFVGAVLALILSFGIHHPPLHYLVSALVLTFAELFNWRSTDNLTLPLLGLILAKLLF